MMADAKEENMGEYIAKWHRELGILPDKTPYYC